MKVIKIAKKNNSDSELFIKNSYGIEINEKEKNEIKQRIKESIKTHIRLFNNEKIKINKKEIQDNLELFFNNKINLKTFLNSLDNKELNKYLNFDKLNYKLKKNDKELKNLFWKIRQILGKNFLLTVGDIFVNKDWTYNKICLQDDSYYQQLINSLEHNKVKTKSLTFDVTKYKDVFKITPKFKNECIDKVKNNYKVSKCKNSYNKEIIVIISNILFKAYESFVYKNIKNISNIDDKKLYRKHKIRLLNIVGKDLKFKVNNLNEKSDYNDEEITNCLISWIEKLVEEKINILSKPDYFKQTIKLGKYITITNSNINENEKIAAHKIHSFYKNFSSIIGSSIFNYNKKYLNQNSKFIDFSDNLDEKMVEYYLKLNFDKNLDINQVFALNTLRNTIMHIRDFNFENDSEYNTKNQKIFENIDKNLLKTQINKLSEQYKKNIEIKFEKHKISQSKLDLINFDNALAIPKFKKIKYLLENTSKLNEIENHNLVKSFLIEKNQDIERYNANHFYLIQLYENNFCTWLKQEKRWTARFKQNVLENIKSFQKKLTWVTFDEYLKSQSINDFIYKSGIWQTNKENEALKNKENIDKEIHSSNIILNIYLSLFDLYLQSIDYKTIELETTPENLKIKNIKIINTEDVETNKLWYLTFIYSFYNLTKYELAQLKNLFVKWQTRFIENEVFSVQNLNIMSEYKILFDKKFIQNNIILISLLMNSKDEVVETQTQNKHLNENIQELIDNSYEDASIYNNQNLELINYEYSFYPNIINKFVENGFKISSEKQNTVSKLDISKEINWETKKKLNEENSQNRVNNGQTILDSLNLLNELKYWLIRHAMYREYVLIDISKIKFDKNDNKNKEILQTISTLFPNDLELVEELIEKISKENNEELQKILIEQQNKLKNQGEINGGEIRNSLLHLNQLQDFFAGESENNIVRWKTLLNILNDIRIMYNQDKHIKNSIIPSLKRLFQKYDLEIEFIFDNHIIKSINLKSKIKKDEEEKSTYTLRSKYEMKVFNIALGIEAENERI